LCWFIDVAPSHRQPKPTRINASSMELLCDSGAGLLVPELAERRIEVEGKDQAVPLALHRPSA
jgi:hypothetical protein